MRQRNCLAALSAVLSVAFVLAAARDAQAETFKLDPVHSFIVFQVGHLNLGHAWGLFVAPTGSIAIDDADPSKSSIQVEVKADSFNTANERRDAHVEGPDFFDSKQFPTISFRSTSVKKTGDKTYEASGDITLHGVTKPLTVTLTKLGERDTGRPFGYRVAYETTFTIKRTDFGITTMKEVVGDEVKLFVSLEGTR
jgi:polyisoprenoid-binding protein YceI